LFLFTAACFFIVLSLSRSAWVGLIMATFIASVCIAYRYHPGAIQRYRKSLWVGGSALLLAALPLAYYLFQLKPASAQGRGLTWNATFLLIQDQPFTGIGTGNFAVSYPHYQAAFLERLPDKEHAYFQLAGDNRYAFND